jgi:NADPH:quinone reductase-like Zn-dependent oxidoreductase
VQIAKSFGANLTGADQVIDYTQPDCTKGDQRYDIVLDCVGMHSFSEWRRVLNPKGIFVGVGAPADAPLSRLLAGSIGALVQSVFVSQEPAVFVATVDAGTAQAAPWACPVVPYRVRGEDGATRSM